MVANALLRWQRYLEVSGEANSTTRRQYRRYVLSFVADIMADPGWNGTRDPFTVTEDDVVMYLADYTAPNGQMRGQMTRALRSFYGWAESREVVARNPVARMKPKRPKYGPAPSLTTEQADALVEAARQMQDPRAWAAIRLQLSTACRIGSLIAVTASDVTFAEHPSIVFREAKGDRPYSIPLGPRGVEAAATLLELIDYVPKRGKRRATLIGVGEERYRQWVHEAADRAGIGHVWTHLLRHTTITRLAEEGVDVRTIMEVANWDDPRLLRRYAKASDKNLRAAVSAL